MFGRRWAKEEEDEFRKMYSDPSLTTEDIAAHFGRNTNMIRIKAYHMRIKRPKEYVTVMRTANGRSRYETL